MTEPKKPRIPKWMLVGFFIMGVAAFSGLGALITRAIQKVTSGHGLDTYHTFWLVEFNYISLLVMFGAVVVVLLIGGVLRLHEYFQWRTLEKSMASAISISNPCIAGRVKARLFCQTLGLKLKLTTLVIFTAVLLTSCANPINLRTAQNYAQGCFWFQHQGEWWKARQACGRAAINAELGGADPRSIAGLWYEYGRTSGVICNYSEAKKALEKSLESDKINNGPIIMDYFELARLHFDQKLFKEASSYYQSGVAATPKTIIAQDPIGYADILDEYSEALKQIGDITRSEQVISESKELRTANPDKQSLTKRTPYGKFCDQKS